MLVGEGRTKSARRLQLRVATECVVHIGAIFLAVMYDGGQWRLETVTIHSRDIRLNPNTPTRLSAFSCPVEISTASIRYV